MFETIIKFAAVDAIISTHRATIPFNSKAVNFEEADKK